MDPRLEAERLENGCQEAGKNEDLWRHLDAALASHEVEWRWVRGHTGHADNERADALARKGAEEAVAT